MLQDLMINKSKPTT